MRNIDEGACSRLSRKRLLGAVVDAYEKKPLPLHPLRTQPNVLLTPHIGASTMEAQRNVAVDVCIAVRDALLSGELSRSINVADMGGQWSDVEPALTLARRAAAVARAILATQGTRAVQRVDVRSGSALAGARSGCWHPPRAVSLRERSNRNALNLINARRWRSLAAIDLCYRRPPLRTIPTALKSG